MGKVKIYKCGICGFESKRSDMYSHIRGGHSDILEAKCKENGLNPKEDGPIHALTLRYLDGFDDFERCPKCGEPVVGKTSTGRRLCEFCGCVPQNENWRNSMRKWLDSDASLEHREQARELGKVHGKITGVQNLKNYLDSHKEDLSKRGKLYGKTVGAENLRRYNTLDKYHDIRVATAKKSAKTREANPEYVLKRAEISAFNTSKRREGYADLYVFRCKSSKGHDICKVGYSRDFMKYRKWAYLDFSIDKVWIRRLESERVLEFEQICLKRFSHYWMQNVTGKSEWYWGVEFPKILDLAKELGIDLEEKIVTYD